MGEFDARVGPVPNHSTSLKDPLRPSNVWT